MNDSTTKIAPILQTRPFELGVDYPSICEWWRARKWKGLPVDALPRNGIIIFDNERSYAAIFVWFIESDWAWIDYLVTNPEAPATRRARAVYTAVAHAKELAQSVGSRRIISILSHKGLISIHKRLGFVPGDQGMTTMVCLLDGGN